VRRSFLFVCLFAFYLDCHIFESAYLVARKDLVRHSRGQAAERLQTKCDQRRDLVDQCTRERQVDRRLDRKQPRRAICVDRGDRDGTKGGRCVGKVARKCHWSRKRYGRARILLLTGSSKVGDKGRLRCVCHLHLGTNGSKQQPKKKKKKEKRYNVQAALRDLGQVDKLGRVGKESLECIGEVGQQRRLRGRKPLDLKRNKQRASGLDLQQPPPTTTSETNLSTVEIPRGRVVRGSRGVCRQVAEHSSGAIPKRELVTFQNRRERARRCTCG